MFGLSINNLIIMSSYYRIMNLKSQISKFRSEILVGRYESAIPMAKNILSQIEILITLKILKDDRLQSTIQEQYQKCLMMASILKQKISISQDEGVKKWQNKGKQSQAPVQEGKWKRKNAIKQKAQVEAVQSWLYKPQLSPVKTQHNKSYIQFEQTIQRQIMIRIKMPSFFKSQTCIFKILSLPEEHMSNILSYFRQNGFTALQYGQLIAELNRKDNSTSFLGDSKEWLISNCSIDLSDVVQMREELCSLGLNCVFVNISANHSFQII